jgi:putative copper resistance protein D
LFDPLIWARLVHFAATIAVTGAIFFLGIVAEPAFREAKTEGRMLADTRRRLAAISWIGLAVAIISGAAWLVLEAAQMADVPLAAALSEGTAWTVLSDTDFGAAWTARLVVAGLLAASLPWFASSRPNLPGGKLAVGIALAAALVGTLAWAGHAAAGTGIQGSVHLAADILHLIAAAAWVGALVPLALLLGAALADPHQANLSVARAAVRRFSTLGIASVATLTASGLINTWVLAGSIPALVDTDYGRLLMAKILLFLVMLSLAGVNRMWLTPRLERSPNTEVTTSVLRRIGGNTLVEAGVGAVIIVIISVLGTLPPGLQIEAANWRRADCSSATSNHVGQLSRTDRRASLMYAWLGAAMMTEVRYPGIV